MRRIFILLLLVFSVCGFAQVTNVQDSLFPKISFDWSEYSTVQRSNADFSLIENEQNVPFEMMELNNKKTKTVLFLWEDMASHSGQYRAFKQILTSFFSVDKANGDKFNVAVFNRRPFNATSGGNNWHLLSDKFLSGNEILDKINTDKSSAVHYPKDPFAADLYASIEDALKLFNECKNEDKMIVLMTAGLNVSLSGATKERASLEEDARKANIPIYVVYYPYSGNTHIPSNIIGIAENTQGKVISLQNTTETVTQLVEYYTNLSTRNYRFGFTTNQKLDGKRHTITLQISNGKNEQARFNAPNMTFRVWVKENLWLFIAIVVSFITLVGIVIWLISRKSAQRRRKIKEDIEKKQYQIDELQGKQERERQEREETERKRKEEETNKIREEEEMRLIQLMQTKNLYPRLQCKVVGSHGFIYNITKPHTTIGRKGYDNDVTFDSSTVTKKHAEIIFTGTNFEIIDKGSTNKVIVNGEFFQRTPLKDGDIIGLGEAVINFYM